MEKATALYSSGTPTRIALAILGVQSAGFAHFYNKKQTARTVVVHQQELL